MSFSNYSMPDFNVFIRLASNLQVLIINVDILENSCRNEDLAEVMMCTLQSNCTNVKTLILESSSE